MKSAIRDILYSIFIIYLKMEEENNVINII